MATPQLHPARPAGPGALAREETEARMVARYAGDGTGADAVRDAVAEAYRRLADARVTSFVPVLVERSVRRRVR